MKYVVGLVISTSFTALLNFLVQVFIARYSNAEVFGIFSIYNTIILMSLPIVSIGLGHYLIKKNSQQKKGENIKININEFFLIFIFGIIGVIFLTLFFNLIFESVDIIILFFLSFGVIGYVLHELIQSNFIGNLDKRKIILWQPYLHLLRLFSLFIIIYIFGNIEVNSLGYFSIFFAILMIISVFLLKKNIFYIKFSNLNLYKVNEILKESVWFSLIGFFYIVYSQINIIYIGKKIGPEMAGYFNIGYTFVLLSLILPNTIYYKILLPKLHKWIIEDIEKIKKTYLLGGLYAFLSGCLVAFILYFGAEYIIKTIYGGEFIGAKNLFEIVVLSIPFFYLSIHLGIYSYLGGRQKYKVMVLFLVTLFSLVANYVSIENFGINGVAISLIFTTGFMSLLYWLINHIVIFKTIFKEPQS